MINFIDTPLECSKKHTRHFANVLRLAHKCPSVWRQPGDDNIYVRACVEDLEAKTLSSGWNGAKVIWVWVFGLFLMTWLGMITGCFDKDDKKKKRAKLERRDSTVDIRVNRHVDDKPFFSSIIPDSGSDM